MTKLESGQLPITLVQAMQRGEAVLFLGAGAGRSASHPKGTLMPLGHELRDILCDEFLGGQCKGNSLDEVASFVENERSRNILERFISDLFRPFRPGAGHMLLPQFRWRSLFTVNFDLLVENAYHETTSPLQKLETISQRSKSN